MRGRCAAWEEGGRAAIQLFHSPLPPRPSRAACKTVKCSCPHALSSLPGFFVGRGGLHYCPLPQKIPPTGLSARLLLCKTSDRPTVDRSKASLCLLSCPEGLGERALVTRGCQGGAKQKKHSVKTNRAPVLLAVSAFNLSGSSKPLHHKTAPLNQNILHIIQFSLCIDGKSLL